MAIVNFHSCYIGIVDGGVSWQVGELSVECAAARGDGGVFISLNQRVTIGSEVDRVGCIVTGSCAKGEAAECAEGSIACFGAGCGGCGG